MQKITQLSKHMANLIAAGEVVERPASVVKELVENAIDAGSTAITIEIENGGIAKIAVTDNGCGIEQDDVETAFLRHATSKIHRESDLAAIETMGFRGEALAAISAVSKVTMQTKTADESIGTRIALEGGAVMDLSDAGCPTGTKITVCDLFFNTPARHKFLKKDSTEAAYVLNVCQRTAMAHPDISIKLIKDNTVELHTPGDGSLYTTLYCIFGRETAQSLLEVDAARSPVSVYGYVSKPGFLRASRSMQYFFVNDRPVKNMTIQAALEEAFRGKSVSGKFPCAVLNITLPADLVDVNVHPAKTEVKFAVEKRVFEAVYYGVKAVLEPLEVLTQPSAAPASVPIPPVVQSPVSPAVQTNLPLAESKSEEACSVYKKHMNSTIHHAIMDHVELGSAVLHDSFPLKPIPVRDEEPQPAQMRFVSILPPDPVADVSVPSADEQPSEPPSELSVSTEPAESDPSPVSPTPSDCVLPDETMPAFRVIGELFGVYILVEQGDELLIIDKHAAHERIRYNDLVAQQETVPAQTMLDAPVVAVTPEEKALLLANADELSHLGFDLEDFGGSSLIVRTLPVFYEPAEASAAVSELARSLSVRGITKDEKRDRILKMVACKSAIRSGDHSDPEELHHLAARVLSDESVRFCPHGRPVWTTLSKKDLEKRFQRIV